MEYIYELREEDLSDQDLFTIITGIIESILSDFSIELCNNIPYYSDEELKPSISLFSNVIKDNALEKKDGNRLKADAVIGHYLFEHSFEVEPFFLTIDKSFRPFKDYYIKKFKRRSSSFFWHLLTPSQFINHIDLLNLKIDEKRLSNELLALIESDGFDYKTHTTIDNICRLMDVANLNMEQREKYLKTLLKQFVGNGEYSNEIGTVFSDDNSDIKKFSELSNEVMTWYLERGGRSLDVFNAVFKDEIKFQAFIKIIMHYSKSRLNIDFEKIDSEITTL